MHRGTRETIPSFVYDLEEFANGSGTLRAEKFPSSINTGKLTEQERTRLRIDNDTSGIQYVVYSYNSPILWVTYSGWVYKVKMELTQTSQSHMDLMAMLPEGYDRRLIHNPQS